MRDKTNGKLSINQFIKTVCNVLKISIPKMNKVQNLSTPTMLAAYDVNRDTLLYKDIMSWDIYFAIAHELRHKWQFEYHSDWFLEYKSSKDLNVVEYNLQKVELDANGFAVIACANLLEMCPAFDNVDKTIVGAIFDMADKIAEEMRNKSNG